jgi:AsmA protein
MAAFMPLPGENALWSDAIDTDFAKQLDLDLRLSAARATAGQLTLMDVAATAQIKDGLGAFDISDASAFGGIIQAGFRVDQRGDNDQAEFRFLATDIDLQPFGTAAGLDGMLPQAKGTISTIIAGPADEWETLFARAEGSASVKVGPGTMPGIDIEAFRQRAGQGGFFPLRDIPRGTMAFDKAEFRATIARGIARLDVAKVEQPRQTIALTGILPLVGRGIALSGAILPRGTPEAPASAEPLAAFFVGGSWNAPFVSPILPNFPQE